MLFRLQNTVVVAVTIIIVTKNKGGNGSMQSDRTKKQF